MNIQGNALQSQLKTFTVLQPVVQELQSSSVGPGRWQGAALYTPTGLNETIRVRVSREQKGPLVALGCQQGSVTDFSERWKHLLL